MNYHQIKKDSWVKKRRKENSESPICNARELLLRLRLSIINIIDTNQIYLVLYKGL